MCLQETGLLAQKLLTFLGSRVGIIEEMYMIIQEER